MRHVAKCGNFRSMFIRVKKLSGVPVFLSPCFFVEICEISRPFLAGKCVVGQDYGLDMFRWFPGGGNPDNMKQIMSFDRWWMRCFGYISFQCVETNTEHSTISQFRILAWTKIETSNGELYKLLLIGRLCLLWIAETIRTYRWWLRP